MTRQDIDASIQKALAEARLTPEYEQEGRELPMTRSDIERELRILKAECDVRWLERNRAIAAYDRAATKFKKLKAKLDGMNK